MDANEDREQRLHDAKMARLAQEQADKEALVEQRDKAYRELDAAILQLDEEKKVSSARATIIGNLERALGDDFAKLEQSNRLNGELKTDRDHYVGIVDRALDVLHGAGVAIPGHPCGVEGCCGSGLVHAVRDLVSKPSEKRNDVVQVCDSCGWRNDGSRVMYTVGKVVTCSNCLGTSR